MIQNGHRLPHLVNTLSYVPVRDASGKDVAAFSVKIELDGWTGSFAHSPVVRHDITLAKVCACSVHGRA